VAVKTAAYGEGQLVCNDGMLVLCNVWSDGSLSMHHLILVRLKIMTHYLCVKNRDRNSAGCIASPINCHVIPESHEYQWQCSHFFSIEGHKNIFYL
jgi:hypothetical protein